MNDWLGNSLSVGDKVTYSSKSTNLGMVLGELTYVSNDVLKIRPVQYSSSSPYASNKIIVLHRGNSAFAAVTRYFGV